MEDINKLNDIFYDGGIVNLKNTNIEKLESIRDEINVKQSNLKNSIYDIIEKF